MKTNQNINNEATITKQNVNNALKELRQMTDIRGTRHSESPGGL